jgi:hypothetical protein
LPFQIDFPDAEQAALDSLPLSAEAKERLNRFVEQFIADVPDEFRLDLANRPSPDSPYFVVQYILRDVWGDGRIHAIDFHIRDDKVKFGILLIVFIDHH